MKVGDKVKVIYSNNRQFVGRIVGETAKQWKIDFESTGEKRVNKTMIIQLVDSTPVAKEEFFCGCDKPRTLPNVPPSDREKLNEGVEKKEFNLSKRVRRENTLITVAILLVIAITTAAVFWKIGLF